MARLIDSEKLIEYCNNQKVKTIDANDIARFPTIDAAPVKHGKWIENEGLDGDCYYTCSVCHCDWTTIDGTPTENNMRYCPECGAKMDLEG